MLAGHPWKSSAVEGYKSSASGELREPADHSFQESYGRQIISVPPAQLTLLLGIPYCIRRSALASATCLGLSAALLNLWRVSLSAGSHKATKYIQGKPMSS